MGTKRDFTIRTAMASRWRRRPMCILIAESPSPAALREINAAYAFLETNARPEIGLMVELHHPEAGSIHGRVTGVMEDGIRLGFDRGESAVAFALAAVAADMSRP